MCCCFRLRLWLETIAFRYVCVDTGQTKGNNLQCLGGNIQNASTILLFLFVSLPLHWHSCWTWQKSACKYIFAVYVGDIKMHLNRVQKIYPFYVFRLHSQYIVAIISFHVICIGVFCCISGSLWERDANAFTTSAKQRTWNSM